MLTTAEDGEKANEIGAFIPAMDLVRDIAGRTVTADALLTQTAIASCLHGRGAEFVFVAKGNQKGLLREIKAHFSSQSPRAADFATAWTTRTSCQCCAPGLCSGGCLSRGRSVSQ